MTRATVLTDNKLRIMSALFIAAVLLLFLQATGAEKIIVGKNYRGGVEGAVKPTRRIASWHMQVDDVVTEHSLVYSGRCGRDSIVVHSRLVDRTPGGKILRTISNDSLFLAVEKEGETIHQLSELVIAMRLVGDALYYTILSDWETVYVDQHTAVRHCSKGHKWINGQHEVCPSCGQPLYSIEP